MHFKYFIQGIKDSVFGKKVNKRKLIIGATVIGVLMALLIAWFVVSKSNKVNRSQGVNDPELARAMTYGELTEADEAVEGTDNVKFSAFFLRDLNGDGYAQKIKGTCKPVGGQDSLYMAINVMTEGSLKNGKIEILSNNMYFQTALVKDDVINGNYISANTKEILLNDVSVGTQKLIIGSVRSGDYAYDSTRTDAIGRNYNKYSAVNKIVFTGVYVDGNGNETEISKEIEVPVDWYDKTVAELPEMYVGEKENRYQSYNLDSIGEGDTIKLDFKVASQETANTLLLKSSCIEADIPELNGYAPVSVKATGKGVEYSYDESTGILTAHRDAISDLNGNILQVACSGEYYTKRYNEYGIEVEYPAEAYNTIESSITLKVPVRAYYEGYNNPNEEFDNPYKSNVAEDIFLINYTKTGGDVINCVPTVGRHVEQPYNKWVVSKKTALQKYDDVEGVDTETYEVVWDVLRGNEGTVTHVNLFEPEGSEDVFIKADGSTESMADVSYVKGVYFKNCEFMLSDGAKIKVMNADTGEVLAELDRDSVGEYTAENPLLLDSSVKRLKVEMDNLRKGMNCQIVQIKVIDNAKLTQKYSSEEFENLKFIQTTLGRQFKYGESDGFDVDDTRIASAQYDEPLSIAFISRVSPNYITTKDTTKNMKIDVTARRLSYNVEGWTNGIYLVKFPEEVLDVNVNSITVSNPAVKILGYDLYQENGSYFLKIVTENEDPLYYYFTIDCDVIPDSRKLSVTKKLELYAYNEYCDVYKTDYKNDDIYDVDGDGNTTEKVDYATSWINIIGPSSLITSEVASDYDVLGNEASTVVAPQVALIDKYGDSKEATVGVQINNNYSGSITGIRLWGKIPTEGNTFVLNQGELGSTYSTTMVGAIEVPENLKNVAKVYYSVKENPSVDLTDVNNEWTTEVEDWASVKSYLIDLGDYALAKAEECSFSYKIKIPETVDFNDVAYSTHAAYFYLETDEGKLADKTETSKLGFMIAKKFDLELSKSEMGSGKAVKGAFYSIQEAGADESKIVSTDENGKLLVKDLFVDREYVIKELKAPTKYVLSDEEITIKGVDEAGTLKVLNVTSGAELGVETRERGLTAVLEVKDEPRYSLLINKTEKSDGSPIAGVRFRISGKGFASSGKTMRTGSDGKAWANGLYPGEVYTLVEEYAEGYKYDESEFKFRVVWDGDALKAEVIEGDLTDALTMESDDDGPYVVANVQNEKLRSYAFDLSKYEKGTDNLLAGATFRLTGKWMNKEATTDENGELVIDNLYEGIEYTLEEISAPEGYAVSDNVIKFRAEWNSENNVMDMYILEGELVDNPISTYGDVDDGKIFDKDGNEITDKEVRISTETNTQWVCFSLAFEDEPLFKLTKIDGTTQDSLPGAKFAIMKVNDDRSEEVARDTDGKVVGSEETINGEKCYVVETDEKGEIKASLPAGLYKVVEVEAPEGYVLAENVEDRTYYFGIDAAKPAEKELSTTFDEVLYNTGKIKYTDSLKVDDGYIVTGYFKKSIVIDKDRTVNGEEIKLIGNVSDTDKALIIKFNNDDKIVWAKSFGTQHNTTYSSIQKFSDTEVICVGNKNMSGSNYIVIAKYDLTTGELKYSSDTVEIGGTGAEPTIRMKLTKDGGWVLAGSLRKLNIPANMAADNTKYTYTTTALEDGGIIKYSKDGLIEWHQQFAGNGAKTTSSIRDVIELDNGEFLAVGNLIAGSHEINGVDTSYESGAALVRLDANGSVTELNITADTEFDLIANDGSGYMIAGREEYSKNIYVDIDGDPVALVQGAFVIKYDENNVGKWIAQTKTGFYTWLVDIEVFDDGSCAVVGNYVQWGSHLRYQGYIYRVDSYGNELWSNHAGGESEDHYVSIMQKDDDTLRIFGNFEGKASNMDIYGPGYVDYDNNGNIIGYDSLNVATSTYNAVVDTDDGGTIAVGSFDGSLVIEADKTVDNKRIEIISKGIKDGFIMKVNSDGLVEWVKALQSGMEINFTKVIRIENNYIVTGTLWNRGWYDDPSSFTISADDIKSGEDTVIKGLGARDGLILSYDDTGMINWVKSVGGTGEDIITDVCKTNTNGYVVAGTFKSATITVDENNVLTRASGTSDDSFIIKYDSNNNVEWCRNVGNSVSLSGITVSVDDEVIVSGTLANSNKKIVIASADTASQSGDIEKTYTDNTAAVVMIAYNDVGKVKYCNIVDAQMKNINVLSTETGPLVFARNRYSRTITIPAGETVKNEEISVEIDGFTCQIMLFKYNTDGKVEWAKCLGNPCADGSAVAGCVTVDGSAVFAGLDEIFIINKNGDIECDFDKAGEFVSVCQQGDLKEYVLVSNLIDNTSTGEMIRVHESTVAAEIPTQQSIVAENEKKTFEITTDVAQKADGSKGGTISGEDDEPYETVRYGEDSVKEIRIVPDENYRVLKITVNGEEIEFVPADDGSVVMDAFTNVTTDVHVEVEFSNAVSDVVVHHYKVGTEESVSPDESLHGDIGSEYVTAPKLDIPGYEVDLDAMPENASGKFTKEAQEVIYYYKVKGVRLVVHHYLEGSIEVVPGSEDEQVDEEHERGSEYETSALKNLDEKYELVEVPANASGTLDDDETVVNYYYRIKIRNVTTAVQKHEEVDEFGEVSEVAGGMITGEGQADFEDVEYGEDSQKDIEITADAGYQIKSLRIETIYEDGTVTSENVEIVGRVTYYAVPKFTKMMANKRVVVEFERFSGQVVVHHYIENSTTPVEVSDGVLAEDEVKSGAEGSYYATRPKENLVGYELVGSTDNTSGKFTDGTIEVIYYYRALRFTYFVNYLEKGSGKVLAEQKVVSDIPYKTSVEADDEVISIDGYNFDSVDKDALVVKEIEAENVINVYYTKRTDLSYVVNYLDKDSNNVIHEQKVAENVTFESVVNSDDEVIDIYGYNFDSADKATLVVGTGENVINLYYTRMDAVVTVKYLEKGTDAVLEPEDRFEAKVGDEYSVSAKVINGYQLVEHSGNESGKYEEEPLTITYYYLYKTQATVIYIDKMTGEPIESYTQEGLEGDEFATESKSFPNYVLVEEPAEKTIRMKKGDNTLRYYYVHVSAGVIEKHLDIISGATLHNEVHEGNEGDPYETEPMTFDGYDLVEDKLPANAKGTLKVDSFDVIYYYIYRTKVNVKYIDKITGEPVADSEVIDGHEGDAYETERKVVDDYKLVEVPAKADGSMTKEEIDVTYYYVHVSGGVIVNHLDVNTGKQLRDESKIEGYEGDPYETHEEEIPGYELVEDRYPAKAKGTMTIAEITVDYYYVKKSQVNVRYVDKDTGDDVADEVVIAGREGDAYTTEAKTVPGYDLVEEPEVKDGVMKAEPTDVVYYYRRPAKVVARYLDKDSGEEVATEVVQDGYQNDEYVTEAQEVKYYELVETPDNAEGTMKVTVTKDENGKEIVEDTMYVTYYYRKLVFNLKIDKTVASVSVNGVESVINGDLAKVEVYRKDVATAKVQVKYLIKVTNDGELSGKASVLENIPAGMTMSAELNKDWAVNGSTATRETKELKPGESEEFEVVLEWQNGDGNVGTKENVASIVSSENEAGFDEKDATDNEDRADLIVAVSTGGNSYVMIAGGILLVLVAMACGVYIVKRQE